MQNAIFERGDRSTPYGLAWVGPCGACKVKGTWTADYGAAATRERVCDACDGSGEERFEAESVDALRAALTAGLTTLEAELGAFGLAHAAGSPVRALEAVRADQAAHERLGLGTHCALDDLEAYLAPLAPPVALQEAA